MDGHLTWYAARASGLVAWGLVLASIVWGLLLATRVLGRRPTPAWLLSLHRYLGALAVVFVGVHVGAILLDSYTSFGVVDVLVPFTGSWDPRRGGVGHRRHVPAGRDRDHIAHARSPVGARLARPCTCSATSSSPPPPCTW